MIMILHVVVAEQFMPFFFVFVGIVGRFFYDYALEAMENGRYRGQATIEMCITTVVGFKAKLSWNYESPRTHIQRDIRSGISVRNPVKSVSIGQYSNLP